MENSFETLRHNRLNQRSYSGTCLTHQHDFHQLILPRLGRLELQCGGHSGEAAAQQGALIPAGEVHAFSSSGENAFCIVDVVARENNQRLFDLAKHSPFFELSDSLMAQLAFAYRQPKLMNNPETQQLWSNALIASLLSQSCAKAMADNRRLRHALKLMQTHIHRPFEVKNLAAELSMSSTQVHRLFKQHLNTTPQHWIHTMRMLLAPQLMSIGVELSQVALQCGFADQSSFGKAFKRYHQSSPAQWLKDQSLRR